jgi:hypothetical protein
MWDGVRVRGFPDNFGARERARARARILHLEPIYMQNGTVV